MPRSVDRRSAARLVTSVSYERRRVLRWVLAPVAAGFVVPVRGAPARVGSARLWPAQEYTRLILESPAPLAHELITLAKPDRIVLDLPGADASDDLRELPARVHADDPYVARIRFGRKT